MTRLEVGQIWKLGYTTAEIVALTADVVTYEVDGRKHQVSRRTFDSLVDGTANVPWKAEMKTRWDSQ